MFILIVLAVAASGCGEEKKAVDTGDEAPDPCDLVTKADIETIMGEPAARQQKEASGGKSCSYTSVQQPPRTAELTVIKPCSMSDFMELADIRSELVPGIGMHAYWDKAVLSVHSSSSVCIIVSGGGAPRGSTDDQTAKANALAVANMIMEKMGIQELQ